MSTSEHDSSEFNFSGILLFVNLFINNKTLALSFDESMDKITKIAVIQAGSVIYDTPKTLEKLESLTSEAAKAGAQLALFPGKLNLK